MIRPGVYPATGRSTKHDRHLNAPPVVTLRRIVHDLVKRTRYEIDELELDYRAESGGRRRARRAYKTRLGDRRIDDALWSELLQKTLSDLERAAEGSDVFAEQQHPRIATHFEPQGVGDRLEVSQL